MNILCLWVSVCKFKELPLLFRCLLLIMYSKKKTHIRKSLKVSILFKLVKSKPL